jgi:hypothetical protein
VSGVASKSEPAKRRTKGILHSVYFPTLADVRQIRAAAKIKGVRMSVLMREAIMAEANRVLKKAGVQS